MHTTVTLIPCLLSILVLALPNDPIFVLVSTAILNLLYALMAMLLRRLLWTLLPLLMALLCLVMAILTVSLIKEILQRFLLCLAGYHGLNGLLLSEEA